MKRGFEVLALGEMCFEGMGAVAMEVSRVGTGVKCVLRAWGQLQRGFHVLALGEMCFQGMGACPQTTLHPVPTPQGPHAPTQCQHLKPPFQGLPPCPAKHISSSANTSNPLFNCPHALKTHFMQCQHLKPPFQLPPCSQNTFHPVANTSNPLFN